MSALVHILDDDRDVRDALDTLLRAEGFITARHETPSQFLAAYDPGRIACLLLDVKLGDIDGMAFQRSLRQEGTPIPIIVMTGHGTIAMAVRGMKAGAIDFLSKPFSDTALFAAVKQALGRDRARVEKETSLTLLQARYASLTAREQEVAGLVVAGLLNKQIAARLNLQLITVKIHRSHVMQKMEAESLADLVRMMELLEARATGVSRYHPA